MTCKKKTTQGFSLIELIIGVAVFTVIVVSVYTAYTSIFEVVFTSRAKIDAVDLVNEELEIVRNMPYSEVGIANGIPAGVLSHVQTIVRDSNSFTVTTTVRNIDDPFDGTLGGTPNDLSPADHKLVEMDIDCALCKHFVPIAVTTTVSPKNLETASTNGALFIKVFDASGNPIENASVHVVKVGAVPALTIDDVTDATGMLKIVDVPPGATVYQITVSKNGYSTDQTYTATVGNPNPVKPNATVAVQQVTSVSFTIDKVSTMAVTSETAFCSPVAGVHFELKGSKLIGTPSVYKYDQNKVTDGSGNLSISNIEWDSYSITDTDSSYDIIGVNPQSPLNILPNSTPSVALIVTSSNPDTLLVAVTDASTQNPLSGVTVTLSKAGFTSTQTTGLGFLGQTQWNGGAGQATSTNLTKYFSTDGNIDTTTQAGSMILKKLFGVYQPAGTLTSSSFDTGGSSNFQQITWLPASQPAGTGPSSVQMQIATNNDGATWNFVGPDGTSGTYFSTSNQNIDASHNGDRYLRYKLFESTASTTQTPTVSDVSFTFTSACQPPGQVYFSGLAAGTYTLLLSKAGYADQSVQIAIGGSWQSITLSMLPN